MLSTSHLATDDAMNALIPMRRSSDIHAMVPATKKVEKRLRREWKQGDWTDKRARRQPEGQPVKLKGPNQRSEGNYSLIRCPWWLNAILARVAVDWVLVR